MEIKKSITPILQYFGFYLLAAFIGGSVLRLSSELLCIVALAYSIFLLGVTGQFHRVEKKYAYFLLFLFVVMLISYVYSFGKIGLSSCGNLFIRFLLVYALVKCDETFFAERFLKFSAFASCASLILFFLVRLGVLPVIGVSIGGDITSMLFYNFAPIHASQNIGMFGEPGQYVVFLCIALYFARYAKTTLPGKTINRYIVILLITIISAQSTAGFMMLGGLLLMELLSSKLVFRHKMLILALLTGFGVYILFFAEKNSSLYYNVIGKILTKDNTIDLSGGSGSARTDSFSMFLRIIAENPQMLWGVGFDISQAIGFTSCASLVGNIVTFGMPIWIVYHFGMIYFLIKSNRSIVGILELIYIIIVTESSQPNMLNVFLIVPICYYAVMGNKKVDLCERFPKHVNQM